MERGGFALESFGLKTGHAILNGPISTYTGLLSKPWGSKQAQHDFDVGGLVLERIGFKVGTARLK